MKKSNILSTISGEQLIQDFKELGSVPKIAKKYGLGTTAIYSAFKEINYNCIIRVKVGSVVSKEILEEAYARLGSINAIGRELKIDHGSVKRYMEKFDIYYNPQIRYSCDHDFFSRDNELSFYVAGFMAADGCIKDRKGASGNIYPLIYIGLSIEDRKFLEEIKKIMKADNPIHDYLVKNSKRNSKWNDTWKSEIAITSQNMWNDLHRFNIVPRKSMIYTFPQWLIDHSLVSHFLRGYNDGDGSFFISKDDNQIHFAMRGTSDFLTTARSILEKQCNLDERKKDIRISSGQGVLEYGGNHILSKIADFLYKDATFYMKRKYDIAIKAQQLKIYNKI